MNLLGVLFGFFTLLFLICWIYVLWKADKNLGEVKGINEIKRRKIIRRKFKKWKL